MNKISTNHEVRGVFSTVYKRRARGAMLAVLLLTGCASKHPAPNRSPRPFPSATSGSSQPCIQPLNLPGIYTERTLGPGDVDQLLGKKGEVKQAEEWRGVANDINGSLGPVLQHYPLPPGTRFAIFPEVFYRSGGRTETQAQVDAQRLAMLAPSNIGTLSVLQAMGQTRLDQGSSRIGEAVISDNFDGNLVVAPVHDVCAI